MRACREGGERTDGEPDSQRHFAAGLSREEPESRSKSRAGVTIARADADERRQGGGFYINLQS